MRVAQAGRRLAVVQRAAVAHQRVCDAAALRRQEIPRASDRVTDLLGKHTPALRERLDEPAERREGPGVQAAMRESEVEHLHGRQVLRQIGTAPGSILLPVDGCLRRNATLRLAGTSERTADDPPLERSGDSNQPIDIEPSVRIPATSARERQEAAWRAVQCCRQNPNSGCLSSVRVLRMSLLGSPAWFHQPAR